MNNVLLAGLIFLGSCGIFLGVRTFLFVLSAEKFFESRKRRKAQFPK